MSDTRCFCGEEWNLPSEECMGGHPMTLDEVEILRVREEHDALRARAEAAEADCARLRVALADEYCFSEERGTVLCSGCAEHCNELGTDVPRAARFEDLTHHELCALGAAKPGSLAVELDALRKVAEEAEGAVMCTVRHQGLRDALDAWRKLRVT